MSLCFRAAWSAKCNHKISEREYLNHLLAHFRGVRHPEDSDKPLKLAGPNLAMLDEVGSSIREMALKDNYQPLQDTSFLEDLFLSCIAANCDQVEAGIKRLKVENFFPVPLQPLATIAAVKCHADILQLCLDEGAVFDAYVDHAILRGLREPEMLDTLLRANWHNMQQKQETLDNLVHKVLFRDVKLLFWLFEHGAKVNVETIKSAAFHHATSVPTMALLVSKCGIEQFKYTGALQLAAANGRQDMVEYLLDAGADVEEIPPMLDPRERGPFTALYEAVEKEHTEIVRILLDHGAQAENPWSSSRSETTLQAAERLGNAQIIDLLRDRIGKKVKI